MNNRVIKQFKLGEDHMIFIRFRGSSKIISAKALDVKKDDDGQVIYAVLDRLIHKPEETALECEFDDTLQNNFKVSGCYVTELSR